MDVFTHVLIGYLAGLGVHALRRDPAASATAHGLVGAASALAPDLDAFVAALARFDALYPLQHRGASHSLVGAPLAALLSVWLMGLAGARWKRLSGLAGLGRWPGAWMVVLAGAWSHLVFDGVTHHGVPLLWPFSVQSMSLEVFHWMVWWLAPPSAGILWLRWRRHWSDRRVVQAGAVVLAVIVVLGGVRVALQPDGDAYATRLPSEWIVVDERTDGFRVDLVRGETSLDAAFYAHDLPPESEAAVRSLQATAAYRGFLMDSTGPLAWTATSDGDGWNLTVRDVVQRFEARDAPPFAREAWLDEVGVLQTHVDGDGGVHVLRP